MEIIVIAQTMSAGRVIEADPEPQNFPKDIAAQLIIAKKAVPVKVVEETPPRVKQPTIEEAVEALTEFGEDKEGIEAYVLNWFGFNLDKRLSPENMIEEFKEKAAVPE